MIGQESAGSARIGLSLEHAVAALRAGELVAFPTETVYGLGADASNPAAVAKIFAAKGRPADHPLIVHLPGVDALAHWARDIPTAAYQLAAAFWPGPLTLILKRSAHVPDAVTGGQDTVGLRVPDHRLALALLRAFGGEDHGGIAAPSANRYGRISPTTAAHVREELGERVTMILDGGPCQVGIESTIVDLSGTTPRILRPGAISGAALARVLGTASAETAEAASGDKDTPRVSGSLAAHYAPHTPLCLVPATELVTAVDAELRANHNCTVLARTIQRPVDLPEQVRWHVMATDAARYAQEFYATLRRFDTVDTADCAIMIVETPPDDEAWRAIADRLRRAACGSGNKTTD